MKRLIECVPNFSEGRDLKTVDALVDAMSGIPGAWILDRTSDADHNRTVITLAGEPEAVAEAAVRGVGRAAALIDLSRHSGVHPRIGATDVLPFIPLDGVSMDDCVQLARRVGQEIWERYRIPIYFYEAAATRPERVNLENVRRGQFEGLLKDALQDPDRSPDIGEPRLHPTAGAIAVGARKLLIAYNIHINTNDVSIAKKIAKAIRFSSGGLRHVKAIGLEIKERGQAQVSINLTDYEQTPLHRVFEMVKREAERHGCAVSGSEIIGLLPRKAIEQAAEYFLQIENFSSARILENRLAEAAGNSIPQHEGAEISDATIRSLLTTLHEVNQRLAEAMRSRKFAAPSARLAATRDFTKDAVAASLEIATTALELFEAWMQLESTAKPSMLSDFRAGRKLALGAARDALNIVEADLKSIPIAGNPSDE